MTDNVLKPLSYGIRDLWKRNLSGSVATKLERMNLIHTQESGDDQTDGRTVHAEKQKP